MTKFGVGDELCSLPHCVGKMHLIRFFSINKCIRDMWQDEHTIRVALKLSLLNYLSTIKQW